MCKQSTSKIEYGLNKILIYRSTCNHKEQCKSLYITFLDYVDIKVYVYIRALIYTFQHTCNMRSTFGDDYISLKIISAFLKRGPSMKLPSNYLKCANYLNDIVSYMSCLVALPLVNSMICRWTNKCEGYGGGDPCEIRGSAEASPGLYCNTASRK